jgi:hypothetical protein
VKKTTVTVQELYHGSEGVMHRLQRFLSAVKFALSHCKMHYELLISRKWRALYGPDCIGDVISDKSKGTLLIAD